MGIELDKAFEERQQKVLDKIDKYCGLYNIHMSDTVKSNLVIHLTLSITRQLSNNYISTSQSQLEQCKQLETYPAARLLVKELAADFNVIMHHIDYYYAAMYFADMSLLDLDFDSDIDVFTEDKEEIMEETISEINSQLGINLRQNTDFYNNMTLHFYPALERLENNEQLDSNPLAESIKLENQIEYKCAEIMNAVVNKHYNKSFNECELSYITLHFGTAFQR